MTDEPPPRGVRVPAAALVSYTEAVSMRPSPDRSIGPGSTDLLLPQAIQAVSVDELLLAAQAEPGRSEMFDLVLARRRSVREYGALAAADLVRVLDQVFKLQGFAEADDGAVRRFRPIPSAGARHPIIPLVLIGNAAGLEPGLWRLDTDGRRLLLVETDSPALDAAWSKLVDAGQFEKRPPAVVVLGARFDATLSRYPSGAALVWRDAGVALGSLHLAATAAGLRSCILGTAGILDADLLRVCGLFGSLVGDVGSLAVGGPATAS